MCETVINYGSQSFNFAKPSSSSEVRGCKLLKLSSTSGCGGGAGRRRLHRVVPAAREEDVGISRVVLQGEDLLFLYYTILYYTILYYTITITITITILYYYSTRMLGSIGWYFRERTRLECPAHSWSGES